MCRPDCKRRIHDDVLDRQVGNQRAEGDGNEQQRLEALDDGKIEQRCHDHPHRDHLPLQMGEAGALQEFSQCGRCVLDYPIV
jgi:hypothetical protein